MLLARRLINNNRIYFRWCCLIFILVACQRAKSERINALRKQYDIFLEEDKKRKERNEYILGRLDKMRYSAALVPVGHKLMTFDSRPALVNHRGYQTDCTSTRDFQPSVTNRSQLIPDINIKNNEDILFIKEISKNYILIPKLRSSLNDHIQNLTPHQNTEQVQELYPVQDKISMKDIKPNTNENMDWKSKYDILNTLKNEEKQTLTFDTGVEDVPEPDVIKETLLEDNNRQFAVNYDSNIKTDVHIESANKYLNELPEKDFRDSILCYELKNNDGYSRNDIVYTDLIPEIKTCNEDKKVLIANDDPTNAIDFKLQNISLDYNQSDATNMPPVEESQPEYNKNLSCSDVDVSSKQSVNKCSADDNVKCDYPVKVNPAINGQHIAVERQESGDAKQAVYLKEDEINPIESLTIDNHSPIDLNISDDKRSVEIHNIQESTPKIHDQMKTDAEFVPEEQMEIQMNVNQMHSGQAETVIEQTDNLADITKSIEEFEAEQKEMFYSEEVGEQDVGAFQSEHYQYQEQQNQEYDNHADTNFESYPVEISDQEMTERYDPNYEQQYVSSDQELQQQQYESQQYPGPEGYNQSQPEFDQLQIEEQNNETQEQVEQVLDAEDGYIEQQHLARTVEKRHKGEAVEIEKPDAEDTQVPGQVIGS